MMRHDEMKRAQRHQIKAKSKHQHRFLTHQQVHCSLSDAEVWNILSCMRVKAIKNQLLLSVLLQMLTKVIGNLLLLYSLQVQGKNIFSEEFVGLLFHLVSWRLLISQVQRWCSLSLQTMLEVLSYPCYCKPSFGRYMCSSYLGHAFHCDGSNTIRSACR